MISSLRFNPVDHLALNLSTNNLFFVTVSLPTIFAVVIKHCHPCSGHVLGLREYNALLYTKKKSKASLCWFRWTGPSYFQGMETRHYCRCISSCIFKSTASRCRCSFVVGSNHALMVIEFSILISGLNLLWKFLFDINCWLENFCVSWFSSLEEPSVHCIHIAPWWYFWASRENCMFSSLAKFVSLCHCAPSTVYNLLS